MTSHEFALAVARMIRARMYYDDGSLRPCTAGELNPLWVAAVSNNAAMAIAELFESEGQALAEALVDRGAVVHGEIKTGEPVSRYGFSEPQQPMTEEDWNDPRIK